MELHMGSKPGGEKSLTSLQYWPHPELLLKLCDLCVDATVLADKGQTLTYHSNTFR